MSCLPYLYLFAYSGGPAHIVLCFSLSRVSYVAIFSGLSFLDCTFGIL